MWICKECGGEIVFKEHQVREYSYKINKESTFRRGTGLVTTRLDNLGEFLAARNAIKVLITIRVLK